MKRLRHLMLAALIACAAACVSEPPPRPHRYAQQPPAPPPPQTQVYFYPTSGQSPEQQSQDRYECYLWAVRQSGFDPSVPSLAPHQRIEYVPRPAPGANTVAGALTGAILGATVAHRGDEGAAAVVGAVAGGAIGAASDSAQQAQADRVEAARDRRDNARDAQNELHAEGYRRAMSACLGGHGYSVE